MSSGGATQVAVCVAPALAGPAALAMIVAIRIHACNDPQRSAR